MSNANGWKPNRVVAPAEILQEWLDEHHLTPGVIATVCAPKGNARDYRLARICWVLLKQPMAGNDALILAKATQTHSALWLGLEHNYRAALAAGLTDASGT